ncbi:MAG: helix-turn-helix domain-containing protein [Chitinophagaceae bacterium]
MNRSIDLLALASQQPVFPESMVLLQEKDRQIPGSVQYQVQRFKKNEQTSFEDVGVLAYQYTRSQSKDNYLELRFCISGNVYCRQKDTECDHCQLNRSHQCGERVKSIDVIQVRFSPVHLSQFVKPGMLKDKLVDGVLSFTHPASFAKTLPLCGRTRMVLESLLNHTFTDSLENIYSNAQIQMLLLYSLECMLGERHPEQFQCKFLANEQDREKIVLAREILLQHIGEPLTIKELSRKVAINECYLKKGFKELFGTTIFDFYQSQRMEHARYLLYEKGLSVTEVSVLLGYSSISHFSTAFKKHSGLKPCELLLR